MDRRQAHDEGFSMSERDVANARLEVAAARERMMSATHELQGRLKPTTLASNAWDGVREKSALVAGNVSRTAARRPVAAGAVAVGVAAFLARKPLWRLIGRIAGKTHISDGD
jgi:hypothetical protein